VEALQEDAVGLEALIATGEAEQCCEGVAGSEECDNKDGQNCLAEPKFGVFCVEAGQYEVAARH
jgi:hypothetical protein